MTFGPTKNRNFKQKINKGMRKRALFMVLSAKAEKSLVLVLEDFKLEGVKTKTLAQFIKKLPVKEKKVLIILPGMEKNMILSARNLPGVGIIQAGELNDLVVLGFQYLVIPKESLKVMKETFAKES